MISLVSTQGEDKRSEFVLVKDNQKPTVLLVGLVICELAFDCLVAYGAFKVFKALKR